MVEHPSHSNSCYRHRAVNDLHWLLTAAPLVTLDDQSKQWFFDLDLGALKNWLTELDKTPTPLLNTLASLHTTRIGIYFETLLGYFFEYWPTIDLIGKNLQVERNKKTLGEFDFVIHDLKEENLCHLEVAVKFYLGGWEYTGEKPNPNLYNWGQWIGPGCKDTLALKMERVLNHQLPLGSTTEGLNELNRIAPNKKCLSHLFLVGRCYFPYNHSIEKPYGFTSEDANHLWIRKADFINSKFYLENLLLCPLPRTHWLSPLTVDEINESEQIRGREILNWLDHQYDLKRMDYQFAVINERSNQVSEEFRLFIVS